jgi:hypothetical protein
MEPLSTEHLIHLRNNLDISKLHEHDPEFDKMIPFLEENLLNLQKIRQGDLQKGTFPDGHFQLIDFTQFITVNMLDFLIAFQSYFSAKTKWSKNYFCRQLALIMHEFLEDVHPALNETLRKNSEIKRVDSGFMQNLNDVSKKLAVIKLLKYDEHIRDIRMQTAAHKETDIQQLYNAIVTLDEKLIIACSTFLLTWIIELSTLLKDLPSKL